jgi:hypothetical protein
MESLGAKTEVGWLEAVSRRSAFLKSEISLMCYYGNNNPRPVLEYLCKMGCQIQKQTSLTKKERETFRTFFPIEPNLLMTADVLSWVRTCRGFTATNSPDLALWDEPTTYLLTIFSTYVYQ